MNKQIKDDNTDLTPLLQCIDVIKGITLDSNIPGLKHQAQLFTSCLALLAHLRIDRHTIEQHNRTTFPLPDELPAINHLFHDKILFTKIVSLLRSKHSGGESQLTFTKTKSFSGMKPSSVHPQPPARIGGQHMISESRKRQLPVNGETEMTSRKKIMISPKPAEREIVKGKQYGASLHLPSLTSSTSNPSSCITANFSVLAAIILYSALQYLDQWPPILVKAFAEDSFGQRLWVDDARCKLFVENLSLVLQKKSNHQQEIKQRGDDTSAADEYLKNFHTFYGDDENCTIGNPPHQAAHMNISNRRVRSTSIDASKLIKARDAESVDEELQEVIITGTIPQQEKRCNNYDDDKSSSSGEEESEEEMMSSTTQMSMMDSIGTLPYFKFQNKSKEERSTSTTMSAIADKSNDFSLPQNWWCPKAAVRTKVCHRFFFSNFDVANKMVGEALSRRLDLKVKQNSSLLSTLPDFVQNPTVRKLASSHLEKWLQSPALSGLARQLFSTLVHNVQNVEPPLREDVLTIENILSMKLKSNQFNIHVEKVIEIINNVPNLTVCHQVVDYLISKELQNRKEVEGMQTLEVSDVMRMLDSVIKSSQSPLIYESLAKSFLNMCLKASNSSSMASICEILQSIAKLLGQDFDGFKLVEAIINCSKQTYELDEIRNVSRLIFECSIIMVPSFSMHQNLSSKSFEETTCSSKYGNEVTSTFSKKLFNVRKILLSWFFSLNPSVAVNPISTMKHEKEQRQKLNEPDFDSVLDGETTMEYNEGSLFDIMRFVMFLVKPDTRSMKHFIEIGISKEHEQDITDKKEDLVSRINFCMDHGCGVDENLLRTIIKSTTNGPIDAKQAISLIELILYNCRNQKDAYFSVNDCEVVWALYNLSEYTPSLKTDQVPRLACPGLWWRVTGIILVLCGKSPNILGSQIWQSSPTLRSLIKMVTSSKFRFPTTDFNEVQKEEIMETESKIRETEFEIAELLFFPGSKRTKLENPVEQGQDTIPRKGSRVSARQREKQARLLAIQREKERARELAEIQRRRQKVKEAQKSIMIFDPKTEARKPRKESVQLFYSIDAMFQLADAFRITTDPDYILLTIGSLLRDGIERAYDWLIPIISSYPDIINRLPPSASCFLLLRAYGAEGDENNQLLELSSPLLNHVTDSIIGKFGQDGSERAAEILFFDLADKDACRRRCARRVLQESLGKSEIKQIVPSFGKGEFSWLIALTETEYKSTLMKLLYPRLLSSLTFEKGHVLRAYIMALDHFLEIGIQDDVKYDLPLGLCDLLSSRPKECVDAMSRFEDLAAKLTNVVHKALNDQMTNKTDVSNTDEILVNISMVGRDDVIVAYKAVRASLVLIGSWKSNDIPPACEIMNLVDYLLPAREDERLTVLTGAASAVFMSTKEKAVQIDDWVTLAKSKCSLIAKRSILSTPDIFLPRLILCCGLPRSSFTAIITRLDRLGESSSEKEKTFKKLLLVSKKADLSAYKRNTLIRTLLGRINAYITLSRNSNDCNSSEIDIPETSSFISWLKNECKLCKGQHLSKKRPPTTRMKATLTLTNILKHNEEVHCDNIPTIRASNKTPQLHEMTIFDNQHLNKYSSANYLTQETIELLCKEGRFYELDRMLGCFKQTTEMTSQAMTQVSINMIGVYRAMQSRQMNLSRLLLHWIPSLTMQCNKPFWQTLFDRGKRPQNKHCQFDQLLLSRCLITWSKEQIMACQRWILDEIKRGRCSGYATQSLIKCFLFHSGEMQLTPQHINSTWTLCTVLGPKEESEYATILALKNAQEWFEERNQISWPMSNEPLFMSLLLQIGSIDKKHFDLITEIIVSKLPSDSWEGTLLPVILLRLYASNPACMNLGGSKIRDLLVVTTSRISQQWLEWRTPLDTKFCATISHLTQTAHRQYQLIFDLSKKHPLIVLKHVDKIANALDLDTQVSSHRGSKFIDSRLPNQSSLIAEVNCREIHVSIAHWGIFYTESLWVTTLDLLLALPAKIIFTCGLLLGLKPILDMYVKLLFVQSQIGNETQRLTKKISSLLDSFQSTNEKDFNEWLSTKTSAFKNKNNKDVLDCLEIFTANGVNTFDLHQIC